MTVEIHKGLCKCGCGGKAPLIPYSQKKRGWKKGEPFDYISGHNKKRHSNFQLSADGKFRTKYGYVYAKCPSHPRAKKFGYVLEHILVAERALGRFLNDQEVVHHINGVKDDNREENLLVLPSKSEHGKLHARIDAVKACGNPEWRKCQFCHNYDDPAVMVTNGSSSGICHKACREIYWRKYRALRKN